MKSNPPLMETHEKPEDKTLYLEHPTPFDLLEINTNDKTIPELYRELNSLAREQFVEYCYRSKKNFTYRKFKNTNFYSRYFYLIQHLKGLAYWLYNGRENIPEKLQMILREEPAYDNPWGTRANFDTLEKKDFFGKMR